MASGDGHLSGGQAAPRETAAGEGPGAVAAILAPETAARMAAAALALIGAVTREQQVVLNPGFDDFDPESPRRHWTYLPELERPGLPLRALSDAQRKLAHELITASVSMEGYAKVVSIMAMEHVRRALMLVSAPSAAHLFDPERYCFRIFGDPGGPWGSATGAVGMAVRRAPRGAELHRGRRLRLRHAVHARVRARVLRGTQPA